MSALADRIQRALRLMAAQVRETISFPPFTAYLDRGDPLRFLNYAIPDDGAGPPWSSDAIAALCATFQAAGREPRFEIVESCWPGLVESLTANGFALEQRLLGMTCEPHALAGDAGPAELVIERVGRDASAGLIAEMLTVQRAPFPEMGDSPPVDEAAIDRYRQGGAASVVARIADGTPVGSAAWLGVQDGVSEIVAVGVLEPFRRRGIAAALTVAAARGAVDDGAELLFLTPGSDDAARVYERAGFVPAVRCAHLSLS